MVPLFSWYVRLGSTLLLVAMNVAIATSQNFESVSAQTKPLPAQDRKTSFLLAQSSVVETVNKIAQQITVRIDSTKSGNGSGVIVAKQGTTYYVLTAEHVVPKPDNYTLTTPDGQKYPVSSRTVKKLEGVDLAIFQFSSPKAYSVATLANYYIGIEDRPLAFVSGFTGSDNDAKRQFNVGTVFPTSTTIFAAQNAYSMASGRELIYTTFSQPGMSGGPVLDQQGRVIGIHNASETKLEADESSGDVFPVYLGRSLGVPIHTFLGLAPQAQIGSKLLKVENTLPPRLNRSAIQSALNNSPPEQPAKDATAFDWLKYGNRLWRLGQFQEAVSALDRALQLKPNFYQAFYVKGLALSAQDRFSDAIAAFDSAIRFEPRFYEAWRMKAQMLEQLQQYPEALAAINKAIQIQPNDPLLHSLKGDLLFQSKQYNPAKAAYTQALTIKPAYYTYMQRGRSQFSAGDYQGATADYGKAIELQPNDYFSYIGRGTMNAALGKSPAALADLDKAIIFIPAASPYQSLLYMSRGLVKFGVGDSNGAIADWTSSINANITGKTDPNIIAQSYTGRALAYARAKNFPKAIADMGQLIELQPQNASAFYNRGEFYIQAGDPQRAILDLDRAIVLKPDYADAIQTRGLAKQSLKEFQGATEDFKKAEGLLSTTISQDPNNLNMATVYVRRANARLGLGNKQGAIDDIQIVANLFQKAGIAEGAMYQTVQNMLKILKK